MIIVAVRLVQFVLPAWSEDRYLLIRNVACKAQSAQAVCRVGNRISNPYTLNSKLLNRKPYTVRGSALIVLELTWFANLPLCQAPRVERSRTKRDRGCVVKHRCHLLRLQSIRLGYKATVATHSSFHGLPPLDQLWTV